MDPISASSYDLTAGKVDDQERKKFDIGSTKSLTTYEVRSFKNLIPQISAAIIVTSYHLVIGMSLAYSAILIPQLLNEAEFEVTTNQASWIASIIALATPVAGLLVGLLIDKFGRLNVLKLAAIPGISGWILIAISPNVALIITGRMLVGFTTALGQNPAIVYLTEIARKDMRGSLIVMCPAFTSLGMVLTFLMGWFLDWRQVAWFAAGFTLLPCIFIALFVPESAVWLVSQGRLAEARKSLQWFTKYQPTNKLGTLADLQLALLQKDHETKMIEESTSTNRNAFQAKLHAFRQPTGYKPLILQIVLFFFQQSSGIFVFLFYSITFFQEVGSTINPYLASVFIGILRFVICMVNLYTLQRFKRRPLILLSAFLMAACLIVSGMYTLWIRDGVTVHTWVPVVCLLMFVMASMVGLVPIPFTMTAEIFPLEIRGVAHSVVTSASSVIMFVMLQVYPYLKDFFNGIAGLLFFYAAVSLLAALYVYVFLPETHGKRLSDISDYYKNNIVYLGSKRVGKEGEQDRGLLEREMS